MQRIKKIGILIPAYRRPIETRNAIFSALNQDYKDFKVFVAVKGCSEDYANILFINEFSDFIDEGKLVIKICANKCQISNTLDCIRDENISDIDYFIKMDNDDIYLKNYVSNCVQFLNEEYESDNCLDGVGTHFAFDIRGGNDLTWFKENWRSQVYGNQLAFSPKVLDILFKIERGDFQILSELGLNKDKYKNLTDDNLICDIARSLGGFLERPMGNDCFYNDANCSCYRSTSSYLGGKRGNNNPSLEDSFKMQGEEILHVHHAFWEDYFIVFGNRFSRTNGDPGSIISRDEDSIVVKWDKWGKEIFKRHKDGFYIYAGDISIEC